MVCYHNTREGACKHRISIPRLLSRGFGRTIRASPTAKVALRPNDWITTMTFKFYFHFHPIEFSFLHFSVEFGAWNKKHYPLCSHCYFTWYALMTLHYPSSSHTERVFRYLRALTARCLNAAEAVLTQSLYLQGICNIHWTVCWFLRHEWPIESHWNGPSFRQRSYGVIAIITNYIVHDTVSGWKSLSYIISLYFHILDKPWG